MRDGKPYRFPLSHEEFLELRGERARSWEEVCRLDALRAVAATYHRLDLVVGSLGLGWREAVEMPPDELVEVLRKATPPLVLSAWARELREDLSQGVFPLWPIERGFFLRALLSLMTQEVLREDPPPAFLLNLATVYPELLTPHTEALLREALARRKGLLRTHPARDELFHWAWRMERKDSWFEILLTLLHRLREAGLEDLLLPRNEGEEREVRERLDDGWYYLLRESRHEPFTSSHLGPLLLYAPSPERVIGPEVHLRYLQALALRGATRSIRREAAAAIILKRKERLMRIIRGRRLLAKYYSPDDHESRYKTLLSLAEDYGVFRLRRLKGGLYYMEGLPEGKRVLIGGKHWSLYGVKGRQTLESAVAKHFEIPPGLAKALLDLPREVAEEAMEALIGGCWPKALGALAGKVPEEEENFLLAQAVVGL